MAYRRGDAHGADACRNKFVGLARHSAWNAARRRE